MSAGFDLRKNSQSTKFEQRPQIFVRLSLRELWDFDLHPFNDMTIIHLVKNRSKTESRAVSSPDSNP